MPTDLSDIQAAQSVKIIGSDATGLETVPVKSSTGGALEVNLRNDAGTEIGTSGNPVRIDPTGSTTQPVSVASLPLPAGAATEATLATMLTLAGFQARINTLGQKTSALSTPVVLASDQSAIPASQSGTWTTGRTWTLASGSDSVAAIQSGTWNITNITGTVSLPTGAATAANQATEITSLQLIDDIIHAMNGAFNKAAAIGGQLDDTSTTAATEDNVAPVRITPQRAFHTNLRNQAGTEVGTTANPLKVQGSDGTNLTPAGDAAARSINTKLTDGTDTALITPNGDLGVVDVINTSAIYSDPTVTTTASELKVGASRLTNRKTCTVYNTSAGNVFFGYDNTVTSNHYFVMVPNGGFFEFKVGPNIAIWMIRNAGSGTVHISEGA